MPCPAYGSGTQCPLQHAEPPDGQSNTSAHGGKSVVVVVEVVVVVVVVVRVVVVRPPPGRRRGRGTQSPRTHTNPGWPGVMQSAPVVQNRCAGSSAVQVPETDSNGGAAGSQCRPLGQFWLDASQSATTQ